MNWETYLQFALALVFVLALIGLLAWAVRRFGLFAQVMPPRSGKRRLSVVEVAPVDAKRRLVLVRRDDREHLILLGANTETVVEPGIRTETPAEGASE